MDKKINWFIPPIILVILVLMVNIVYYEKRKAISKKVIVKQKTDIITSGPKISPETNVANITIAKNAENSDINNSVKNKSISIAPKPANKSFAIQVASFRKKNKAALFVDSLKKDSYDAYIVASNVPGKGIWYRVRIGDFPTKNEARSLLEEVKAKYLESFIVIYIKPDSSR